MNTVKLDYKLFILRRPDLVVVDRSFFLYSKVVLLGQHRVLQPQKVSLKLCKLTELSNIRAAEAWLKKAILKPQEASASSRPIC